MAEFFIKFARLGDFRARSSRFRAPNHPNPALLPATLLTLLLQPLRGSRNSRVAGSNALVHDSACR